MFNAIDTAGSRPVTSINRSVVSSVTFVSSPFIMGGNESTLSFESRISGYFSNFSRRFANLIPLGCFLRISAWREAPGSQEA